MKPSEAIDKLFYQIPELEYVRFDRAGSSYDVSLKFSDSNEEFYIREFIGEKRKILDETL